jgi:hypothetical protein
MPHLRDFSGSARVRLAVHLVLAVFAITLCWVDVSWAFRPGLFPVHDEITNRAIFLDGSYHQIVHLFPAWFYNDRPVGWAFIRFIADIWGFDYRGQVACLLAVHFANCGLVFLLFRRLGVGVPLSIAGVALFGSLWTTAATATFVGAPFDVFCLFFLLASTLTLLSERRGATVFSAFLFLLALRSKEFAVFTPVLFTVLLALRLPRMPFFATAAALARRLWMHCLVALAIGIRYLTLYPAFRAGLAANDPYTMDPRITTLVQSLAYYVSLIFAADEYRRPIPALVVAIILVAVISWAFLRRKSGVAFGVCAFVLTLQPISFMPHQRNPYYAYAPQVFLILVLCLLAEEVLARTLKREQLPWVASLCVVLICLSWCVGLRRNRYFRDRVNWTLSLRRISRRTAHDAATQFPPMGPETHIYVNHNPGTQPWLFLAGPCSYFQIVNKQRDVYCIIDKPVDQLRTMYANDPGPKFFVNYHDDGSIDVPGSAQPASTPKR